MNEETPLVVVLPSAGPSFQRTTEREGSSDNAGGWTRTVCAVACTALFSLLGLTIWDSTSVSDSSTIVIAVAEGITSSNVDDVPLMGSPWQVQPPSEQDWCMAPGKLTASDSVSSTSSAILLFANIKHSDHPF